MPQRHPDLFEVAVGQLAQNVGIDVVVSKQRFVLLETAASQPYRDIHH
jgi:hypothetical protein